MLLSNISGVRQWPLTGTKWMKRICSLIFCLFCCVASASETPGQEVQLVKYPVNSDNPIYRLQGQYFKEILELALQQSGIAYQLQPVPIPTVPQSRSISLIQQGVYDVHWMATSKEREQLVKPIRIPLFKGLIGWRLMFVHQDNVQRFSALQGKQDLQKLTAGQGRDWPDTQVLESNGFKIFRATTTAGLLQMVSLKRVDYFPRSVIEIWHEYGLKQYDAIVIDPTFALKYPAAEYLFVRNDNQRLHEVIERGLNKAIANGLFDELFYKYFATTLENANLGQRKIINLSNPMMSEQTPLDRKELWYNVD
ncbi:substrate-binding periplasmic protein [Neptunicella sp. SCSIO 80796]|uniref:substrate-binding periplasmic protein n=1 Tax=Neptunicella plasticusilytica TaxID=3117012 RepID=UPI003A4D3E4D